MTEKKLRISFIDDQFDIPYDISLSNLFGNCLSKVVFEDEISNKKRIFSSDEEFLKSSEYIEELNFRLIKNLSEYFNEHFGLHFKSRYWEIVLTPIVMYWTHANYFKYLIIKKFLEDNQADTFAINKIDPPADFFHLRSCDHYSNLIYNNHFQHYENQILIEWFFKGKVSTLNTIAVESATSQVNLSFKSKVKSNIDKVFDRIISSRKIVIERVYGLNTLDKLKLASSYKTKNFKGKNWNKIISSKARNSNAELSSFEAHNEFEFFVRGKILGIIPDSFFSEIPQQPKKYQVSLFFGNPKSYQNEELQYLARIIQNDGRWISSQHGGCYGQFATFHLSAFEFKLADYFITWGWKKYLSYSNFIPLPAPSLSKVKPYRPENQTSIYYVGTYIHPSLVRLDSCCFNISLDDYKNYQLAFFKNIDARIRKEIKFKDYFVQVNWFQYFENYLQQNKIERVASRFLEIAEQGKLIVIDHNGTTMLEALAMNVPTIIFWNTDVCLLSEDSFIDFKELQSAGIWHDSPESAAQYINENFDQISEWWNAEKTQKARETFVRKYALNSSDFLTHWQDLLQNL